MAAPLSRLRREDSQDEFENLKRLIHGKLVDKLDLNRLGELQGDTLRREIRLVVEHLCDTENPLLNRSERERLIEEVLDETFGFGPLEILMKQDGVADIMINGPKNVFIEKDGRIQKSPVTFRDNDHLLQILDRIVSRVGRRIDETSPMCDARLPDGSRLNAIIPPLALDGPSLTIRKFGAKPLRLEDLLKFRSLYTRDGDADGRGHQSPPEHHHQRRNRLRKNDALEYPLELHSGGSARDHN